MATLLKTAVAAFAPQYVNTGTEGSPVWTNISADITKWKYTGKRDSIDVSDWSSNDKKAQSGARTIGVTATIAFRETDTTVNTFCGSFLAGTAIGLKFPFGNKTLIAYFTITQWDQNGDHGQLAQFDATFEMSGTPTIS